MMPVSAFLTSKSAAWINFRRMSSTSSPTYPASVRAVASAMPNGAMSFLTCFWLLPQNEHFRRSPLSPIRATPPPRAWSSSGSGHLTLARRLRLVEHPRLAPRRVESGSDRHCLQRGQHLVDDAVLL